MYNVFTAMFCSIVHKLQKSNYLIWLPPLRSACHVQYSTHLSTQAHLWLCRDKDQHNLIHELNFVYPDCAHTYNKGNLYVESHGILHNTADINIIAFSRQLLYNIQPITQYNNNIQSHQRIVWSDVCHEIISLIESSLTSECDIDSLYIHYVPPAQFTNQSLSTAQCHYKQQIPTSHFIKLLKQHLHNRNTNLALKLHDDIYHSLQHLFAHDLLVSSTASLSNNARTKHRSNRLIDRHTATVNIVNGQIQYDIDLHSNMNRCIVQIALLPCKSKLYISIITPTHYRKYYKLLSRIPGGDIAIPSTSSFQRFSDSKQLIGLPLPPSTAYTKVLEAEIRGGAFMQSTQHTSIDHTLSGYQVVDFGSAPGSFTYIYINRKLRVHSIDTADGLSNSIVSHNNQLYFQRVSALEFVPNCFSQPINANDFNAPCYDIWVSDILCHPHQIIELLDKWLVRYPVQYNQYLCRRFIVTVKFTGTHQYQQSIQSIINLLEHQKHVEYNIKRLQANKNEITVFGYFKRYFL